MRKFLPFILILFILIGLLSPATEVFAQDATGECIVTDTTPNAGRPEVYQVTRAACGGFLDSTHTVTWGGQTLSRESATVTGKSVLPEQIPGCAVITGDFDDCIVKLTYIIFYTIPAFLLGLAANSFNLIISLTLSSTLYTKSTFIPEAWGVVRDLSNLFFILILLYIGIKMILGLGGHDVKKMVVQVVIMALLINFSMFFSQIIIDTSNILALVFYDKINVCTVAGGQAPATGQSAASGQSPPCAAYAPIGDPTKTGVLEKDIAGGIVAAFDPSRMMTAEFFEKARTQTQAVWSATGAAAFVGGGALAGSFIPFVGTAIGAGVGAAGYVVKSTIGYFFGSKDVPVPLMLGIILISGLTMAFAAYSFAVVGIAFLSRLIELWVLIIFSPFAFMSSSVPFLAKAEGIGWDEWIKSLVRVSFMAPIFMFFLYLIFKIINVNLFANLTIRTFEEQGTLEAIILMTLPAFVVLIILHKATEKAQKWSGELGSMLTKGVAVAGTVAGGLALGGGAAILQSSVGKYSDRIAESATAKRWVREGRFGADAFQKSMSYLGSASFDARKGAVGAAFQAVESTTGFRMGASSKLLVKDGGYKADRKKMVEKRMKRAKELEVGEDEKPKQDLNRLEEAKQKLLLTNSHDIEQIDKKLEVWRQRSRDRAERVRILNSAGSTATKTEKDAAQAEATEAVNEVADLAGERGAIKNATRFVTSKGVVINHSTNTTTGLISQTAVDAANTELANATVAATATAAAMRAAPTVAARATTVATAATAARAAAEVASLANPTNVALANAANRAIEAEKDAITKAREATAAVTTTAAANTAAVARVAMATTVAAAANTSARAGTGRSINNLEDTDIPNAHHVIEKENRNRKWDYATNMEGNKVRKFFRAVGMQQAGDDKYSRREAQHKIRMEAKIEDKGGGGGHH